jgi:hypothetical protein
MATTTENKPRMPREMAMKTVLADAGAEADWKNADEARLKPGARIRTNKKFLFRFLPGTGPSSLNLKIDRLPDDFVSERQERFHKQSFARRTKRVHGDNITGENPKYNLDEVRMAVGDDWIRFVSMPGNEKVGSTCYYATDDPQVAAYLRHKALTGQGFWQYLREERPTQQIEFNGISVPNTSEGWDAARKAAQLAAMTAEE